VLPLVLTAREDVRSTARTVSLAVLLVGHTSGINEDFCLLFLKDFRTYGGSFLYHVGGGQPLVSVGFVVSVFSLPMNSLFLLVSFSNQQIRIFDEYISAWNPFVCLSPL